MMDVLYLGGQPTENLSRILLESGYRISHVRSKTALDRFSTYCAVVLHWNSKADQPLIAKAKTFDVPVLVIAADLIAALQAGEPSADLYLEEPASDLEVSTFLIDMVPVTQKRRAAATSDY
jgi:hypothetical protein